MGLSSRRRQGGKKLGGDKISDAKRGAPLRKIVEVTYWGEGLFDTNRVLLECGHKTSSNAISRARCEHCKQELATAAEKEQP